MAWDRRTRAGAMEQVGKLIAEGMGKKDAVKEVAGEMGIHPRTIETWLWPNKRKKRKSGESSPSESSLFTLTEKENIGAKDALARLVKLAADLDQDTNTTEPYLYLGDGGFAFGVENWIETARAKGYSDLAVLGGVAGRLLGEAVRSRQWLDHAGLLSRPPRST